MQAQLQQMSKKNKVTVPFYSPPSRLCGQTPAEIIKEARAAVMNTSAIGIRPVFTSRPFTPKEKERTLFGNVKKRNGRPPSSFSLRNLHGQEPSGVKLPSIEVASKRKSFPPAFPSSNDLYLDNLTEDYDAETLEEIKEIHTQKFPLCEKMSTTAEDQKITISSDHLHYDSPTEEIGSGNRLFDGEADKLKDLSTSDFFKTRRRSEPNQRTNLKRSTVFGDVVKSDLSEPHLADSYRYLMMAQGGGDYEKPENLGEQSLVLKFHTINGKVEEKLADNLNLSPENQRSSQSKYEHSEKEESERETYEKEEKDTSLQDDIVRSHVFHEETVEIEGNKQTICEKQNLVEDELNKCKTQREKSIATEPQFEYLQTFRKEDQNYSQPPSDPLPLEIFELFQTASYYGMEICRSKYDKNSQPPSRGNMMKTVEDYFGEKPDQSLDQSTEENFNSIGNKSINRNGQPKKSNVEFSSENIQFTMNNKKRYHVISEKGEAKEKAYKKWNDSQNSNKSEYRLKSSDDGWDLFWKNSYFRSKENDNNNNNDCDKIESGESPQTQIIENQKRLQRLVNRITELAKTGARNQQVYETTNQLYKLLKESEIILDNKLKESVIKALYRYADNESPEMLLSLARLLLHLKVESALSVACKMIFKVARFDTNDHLFMNEEDILELFLDGIGRASPLDCAESCIYGYGALKFLTMNYNILSRILHMGALDLMTLHLKMINTAYLENGSVGEQTHHSLYQLTGALRHVAAGEGALPLFITTNCIATVCRTLRLFQKDEDIVTNISRTLSLLSTDENITQALMSVEDILATIIDLIQRYKENDKILIRLSFCLGNIVEHSDLARIQLSRNETSLKILLNMLKLYIDKDLEISVKEQNEKNSSELSSETIDDIIVKVIRIIANMSMNPIVGSNLSPAANEKNSLQLSKLLSVLLMRKDPGMTLLATLGCLNNISYYSNTHSVLVDITQGIERVLGLPSEDCQAEAAKVLGNLTRHKEIRDLIYNTGGVSQLIKLLTSQDQEVVKCTCGTLVNMMLDPETRQQFIEAHGIDKLVKALEFFSGDWSLASLATRAIWNSCADDMSSAMLHNDVEHLLNILANSLEEENWNDGDVSWEEYASIATDLLEKISSHLENC